MSTFRIQKDKENPYVMVNKVLINDETLSFKAKGILLYLLSKPDDWKVYESEISSHSKDKIDSVRSGVKELINAGYIKRTREQDGKGKFKGYIYNVFETPQNKELCPLLDFPKTGNPTLLINDNTNNDINIPQKGLCRIGNKYFFNGKKISKTVYQAECVTQIPKEAWK
jgi:hypothetical protein